MSIEAVCNRLEWSCGALKHATQDMDPRPVDPRIEAYYFRILPRALGPLVSPYRHGKQPTPLSPTDDAQHLCVQHLYVHVHRLRKRVIP